MEERDRVRARVLELAAADPRVVAGAAVGSLANGGGDRFSDLDLAFGVAGCEAVEVLDDWARVLEDELGATRLFDLPSGAVALPRLPASRCAAGRPLVRARRRSSARAGRGGSCSSGTRSSDGSQRRRRQRSCSAGECTTPCGPGSASSAAGSGRRSTGSASCATTRWPSPAGGSACRHAMPAVSTTCRARWSRRSSRRARGRSPRPSCCEPSRSEWTACCARPTRPASSRTGSRATSGR